MLIQPLATFARYLRAIALIMAILVIVETPIGLSQVVQLPTIGTFSIQTSVIAPDSGSAYLGGNRTGATGTRSLGPGAIASGTSRTLGSAYVKATIIDLNELDQMIRSQAGSKPSNSNFPPSPTKPYQYPAGQKGKPAQNAEYAYLAALTHQEPDSQQQLNSDTNYYLSLANNAKRNRHWASVELYYKLAWESLPESRRIIALKSLEVARLEAKANDAKTTAK